MKQDNGQLRNLINTAKSLSTNITMSIRNNFPIVTDTQNLLGIARQIVPLINDNYKGIADVLKGAINDIKTIQAIPMPPYGQLVNKEIINLYSLRDIMTTINILDSLIEESKPNHNSRKIFISHASADETIVNAFVKEILLLGCHFTPQEIFCTLDHNAIRTGEDFRNVIVENMKSCDYVICWISENYRQIEFCQNEMGATSS